ncbi:MAG: hypothetical protein ACR2K9_04645 [Solirubrobacteraceae bacterium]
MNVFLAAECSFAPSCPTTGQRAVTGWLLVSLFFVGLVMYLLERRAIRRWHQLARQDPELRPGRSLRVVIAIGKVVASYPRPASLLVALLTALVAGAYELVAGGSLRRAVARGALPAFVGALVALRLVLPFIRRRSG